MYTVKLDGEYIYYPADREYVIYNPVLNQQLDDAGYFEFDMPPSNPKYNSPVIRQSEITVYQDGDEIFNGEVRESEITIDGSKHIYAVGELAFLHDSIQPQARYQDITPAEFFGTLVNIHNAQVEERKRFTVGMVTVTDPNDSIYRFTNYEDTLNDLRDKICERLNGHLRIRKQGGIRYLDLVSIDDFGDFSSQTVRFGENLLEYTANESAQDIATAVIPLGARQEESVVEGLDAYLTIESVNDGKDYVFNENAVDTFGWVKVVKHWDDVTLQENLLQKAEEWLASAQYAQMTLELNAVDLSILETDMDAIKVGDRVRAVAEPFGMDTVFPLQRKVTYLQDPSRNYITLGSTIQRSYTKQASRAAALIEEAIPEQASILQTAKQNAYNILMGTEGGYLVDTFNENMQRTGDKLMNAMTEEQATKMWIRNLGGFGYMKRSSVNEDWELPVVAITMDGAIVADFITAGKLNAAVIKAGILKDAKKNGDVFYLDLDNGVLKGNFQELSIGAKEAATQEYADEGDISVLRSAKSYADGAASAAVDELDQRAVFNKLTNNGQTQGIYLQNEKIYINANYIETGYLSAGLIRTGILADSAGKFSLNMATGALTMNSGTFKGSLDGATGSFKGELKAATGTITDGAGTLKLKNGNLYMNNSKSDGPGVFVEKDGSDLYACWGAKNSAARKDGTYQETNTINVIKAGVNASDERLKQDIEDLDAGYCKSLIFGIKPKRFSYKSHPDELELGVIAQDIAKVQEEYGITKRSWLCYKNDDDMYEVEYKQLIAPIIKVIQEQQKQIERLEILLQEGRNGDV